MSSLSTRHHVANYRIAFPLFFFLFPPTSVPLLIVKGVKMGEQRSQRKSSAYLFIPTQPGNRTMTALKGTTVPRKGDLSDSDSWWKCGGFRISEAKKSWVVRVSSMAETRLIWFGNIPTYAAWWVKKTSNDALSRLLKILLYFLAKFKVS